VYATASEAEYPAELAAKMTAAVLGHATADIRDRASRAARDRVVASAGRQSARMLPLIPEYAPRPATRGSETGDGAEADAPGTKKLRVDTYFTMEEHIEEALKLQHPASVNTCVEDEVRKVWFETLTLGPRAMAEKREEALLKMKELQLSLEEEEMALRSKMHYEVEKVTKGKRLILFRRLLEMTRFPDMSVCELLESGVDLVGEEKESPLFEKRYRPLRLQPEQLASQAPFRRAMARATGGTTPSDEDCKALHEETMQEIREGYLDGPYDEESQVSKEIGDDRWIASRRFLLRQGEDGGKVRVIDDFKRSAINSAFGSSSYLNLQDVDYTVALIRLGRQAMDEPGRVCIPLLGGGELKGDLAEDLREHPPLISRTLDLTKAYKQVAAAPASARFAVLSYPHKGGATKYVRSLALPFGATASVYAFNKLARAVAWVFTVWCRILLSNFYDDYTLFEFEPAAADTSRVVEAVLDLLGWSFAREGKKYVHFGKSVITLGVSLDLCEFWQGTLMVGNKPGRAEKIISLLEALRDSDHFDRNALTALHGLLNFAGGFVMGSALKPASRAIAKCLARDVDNPLEGAKRAAALAITILQGSEPKLVHCGHAVPPLLVYTDGAYEQGAATWGVVVLDPVTGDKWQASGSVPEKLKKRWLEKAGSQIICEIEAYAVALAIFGLRASVADRNVLVFIDNEPCRVGMVKRTSPSLCMASLIALVSLLEAGLGLRVWFERVPSKSNPADLPSRAEVEEARRRFGCEDRGDIRLTEIMDQFLFDMSFDPQQFLPFCTPSSQRRNFLQQLQPEAETHREL
jgi:hypothetical protein